MAKQQFPRLFEPGIIGSVKLKNRVVMAPMGQNYSNLDGTPNERLKRFYTERGKGGIGLIILGEVCWETKTGRGSDNELNIDEDRYIDGLADLAEAIHRSGAKCFIQMAHPGAVADLSRNPPKVRVSASAVPLFPGGPVPHALTREEIQELEGKLAAAAYRAKQAGFDGIEIHTSHGYMFAEFLSPLTNRRTDEYGGDVKGRARFLLEAIKAIKDKCGPDYTVTVRTSSEECEAKGIKVPDAQALAKLLEQAGIAAINLSYGSHYSPEPMSVAPPAYPEGLLLDRAQQVKQAVGIPIIAGGRVVNPVKAEEALRQGKADFIFVARAILADPYWAKKAEEGKLDEIVPCIGCQFCVDELLYRHAIDPMRCSVNIQLGREVEMPLPNLKAAKSKKVVVVGGGPGGLEAARVAALRGHQVQLYDKGPELGGQMLLAGKPPFKDRIPVLVAYYTNQMKKLGVTVKSGVAATEQTILQEKPDAVILANGTKSFFPDIPGIKGDNVVTAEQVLSGRKVGQKVVIIGGELVGCETAEYLIEQGKDVTILRRGERMATGVSPMIRALLLRRLRAHGKVRPGIKSYGEITPDGVRIINEQGQEEFIPADNIVLAAGSLPNTDLAQKLEGKVKVLYAVGDCVKPRIILNAVHEGAAAAFKIQ